MAAPAPARTAGTAEDTLQRKSADPNIASGGRLVAKALKSEGVDTIFTLCGGHIVDIYDGCVDEGIRSAVVNIWVDPREYAPGTKHQTMYK